MSQTTAQSADPSLFGRTIFNVSWMAVLLGVAMQVVMLGVQAAYGSSPAMPPFLADLVQKVSWSFLVCAGLASGRAATGAGGLGMGVAGLLSAPLAFGTARTLHKSTQQALSISGAAAAASPMMLATIKGVEYACLGFLLARLSQRASASCSPSAARS